jgi:hypothetical protein
MTIAGSIILIMLGAILTWAVEVDVAGLDIRIVGVILMIGGVAGLLFGLWRISTARRSAVADDGVVTRRVVERRDEPL